MQDRRKIQIFTNILQKILQFNLNSTTKTKSEQNLSLDVTFGYIISKFYVISEYKAMNQKQKWSACYLKKIYIIHEQFPN